jgi:CRP/FNR family cyclic AMP-dependent transcriptional regulator|tara:strand:- start:357 stop:1046 length:690 start_codon:yes stop_codon:yes gene_type:complete
MATSSLTTDQLKAFQLFQNLEAEDLALLLERHLCSSIAEEQVLVQENDWGETLYLILEGMAKVRCFSPDGEEVVLSLLGPGDVFGEMTLLDEEPRSADVIALIPLRLAKFPGAVFRRLMLGRAPLAVGIARLQSRRLRTLNRRFAVHAADGMTRLLNALLELACCNGDREDPLATIPLLAQRELAVLAGLSRETTSRTLSKLKEKGQLEVTDHGMRLLSTQPLEKRCLL